jgi:hypothetical protein
MVPERLLAFITFNQAGEWSGVAGVFSCHSAHCRKMRMHFSTARAKNTRCLVQKLIQLYTRPKSQAG